VTHHKVKQGKTVRERTAEGETIRERVDKDENRWAKV